MLAAAEAAEDVHGAGLSWCTCSANLRHLVVRDDIACSPVNEICQ